MKIKPAPNDEIDFGASPLLDANMHVTHLDDLDFGAVFDEAKKRYTWPAIPGRVAIHLVEYAGCCGFLIANPDGSGVLIESAANDELGAHAAFRDARASGLV